MLTPYLLGDRRCRRGYYSDGRQLLADWDFHQGADSAAAAYYNVVWRELLARTFHDELTGDLQPDGGQRWFAVVTDLLTRPGDQWWDDQETEDVVETRDDILEASLRAARDDLTAPAVADCATSGPGAGCTGWSCGRRRSASPASPSSSACSTGAAGRSAAAARSRTRPGGTRGRGTTSQTAPRCGWSCRSTTSTPRGGST